MPVRKRQREEILIPKKKACPRAGEAEQVGMLEVLLTGMGLVQKTQTQRSGHRHHATQGPVGRSQLN